MSRLSESARRRSAVAATLLLIALGAVVVVLKLSQESPGWTAYEPSRLFAPQSFWNEPLSSGAPVAPDSPRLVRAFLTQIRYGGGDVALNVAAYSAPVYVVNSAVRPVPVRVLACNGNPPDRAAAEALRAVPIPRVGVAAAGTDHDLVVLQPSTGREWELWEARRRQGQWTACDGGEIAHISSSSGVFPPPTGVAASGLSILAGMIRLSDLRAGRIDHALNVQVPLTTRYPYHVAPADRTDGSATGKNAIPEGTRYRLDPAVHISALHLTPFGAMVARALQRYGMVVSDRSGTVAFQAQDPVPLIMRGRPDPWVKLFGRIPTYQLLRGIPWQDLQALPPTPAVATRAGGKVGQ